MTASVSWSAGGLGRALRLKAVEEVMARYCYAHDERRIDLLAQCLASRVVRQGIEGRGAVLEHYGRIYAEQSDELRRRHVLTNFLMLEDGESRVRVQAYETFYLIENAQVALHLTGVYRMTAVLEDGEWMIQDIASAFDVPYDPGDFPRIEASRFED